MTSRAFDRTRQQVAASVRRTLSREALGIELRLAYVRVAALAGVTALNSLAIAWPSIIDVERLPPTASLVDFGWLTWALVVMILLRRGWYPRGSELVLPGIDGIIVLTAFGAILATVEPLILGQGIEDVAVYCALLALSGGLRLRRASAVMSTVSALLAFNALSLMNGVPPARSSHVTLAIVVSGLFGYWLTRVVRASLEGEVSRTIFRRFLPEHLIERARHDPLSVLGEPRLLDATVLLTDLRGFTALSERLSPDELLDYLSDIQGRLADIVAANGGTVDKFIGDGMLAVFGALENSADHPRRAITAATEILSAIDRLNGERLARDESIAAIGIGVHTGNVIVGCLGSGSRLEFTVIGDAVNATSRLESLTKQLGVSVLVSEATVRRAGGSRPNGQVWLDRLRLTRRGEMSLRGRSAPLSVYSIEHAA